MDIEIEDRSRKTKPA